MKIRALEAKLVDARSQYVDAMRVVAHELDTEHRTLLKQIASLDVDRVLSTRSAVRKLAGELGISRMRADVVSEFVGVAFARAKYELSCAMEVASFDESNKSGLLRMRHVNLVRQINHLSQ